MDDHDYWLAKFARLRVDTATNAPHKPLLLLVILDLAEEGSLGPETLELTPQLAFRFCAYWSIVAYRRRQKPDVRFPFTKLKTEGVWTALDSCGEPTSDHKQACTAVLNRQFVASAADPLFRERARRILIARYFKQAERQAFYSSLGIPAPVKIRLPQTRTTCRTMTRGARGTTCDFGSTWSRRTTTHVR